MNLWRRKLRLAAVAVLAAVAMVAAACSSSSSSPSGSSTAAARRSRAGRRRSRCRRASPTTGSYPFYAITNASVYNDNQFQWLMYRPLYFFGNNTNTNVAINYPLSPANAPVYSNGGKTVTVTMKGWKWSNGETVDANSVLFFLNMAIGEQGELVRLRARPAAGQRDVRHGQREHAHAAAQQGLLVHLVHLQPAGRAQPDAGGLGRHQPAAPSRAAAAAPPTARPTAGPSARPSTRS